MTSIRGERGLGRRHAGGGATAAQSLLGKQFRVTQQRGKPVSSELAEAVIATVHPLAVLRAREADREQAREDFFRDMQKVVAYLRSG